MKSMKVEAAINRVLKHPVSRERYTMVSLHSSRKGVPVFYVPVHSNPM